MGLRPNSDLLLSSLFAKTHLISFDLCQFQFVSQVSSHISSIILKIIQHILKSLQFHPHLQQKLPLSLEVNRLIQDHAEEVGGDGSSYYMAQVRCAAHNGEMPGDIMEHSWNLHGIFMGYFEDGES